MSRKPLPCAKIVFLEGLSLEDSFAPVLGKLTIFRFGLENEGFAPVFRLIIGVFGGIYVIITLYRRAAGGRLTTSFGPVRPPYPPS